ncbi:proton-coupled folate transporter-like [Anastrepha obliqua]|uniref:proton-coupled folate transporter-like n=1 Tax=Anastrepha obliqua TaxID=95512 RepID=UPI0024095C42|nr:proton-coupled folate transporter-like [Anastrepha obliqua]XP_054739027.1 proton-coupled folate transporter-like [Anastrepha obliqua]
MDAGPNERSTLLAKHPRTLKHVRTGSGEHLSDMASDASVSSLVESSTNYQGSVETMASITSSDLDEFNWRRIRFYLVEPMVFILLFAYSLSDTILKNQVIYQTCTTIFFFNETDCRQLGTKNASEHVRDIETTIQPFAAKILMTSTVIESFVPALCGIFIGTWSDRFGRKPLLVIGYSGYALYYALAAIIAQLSTTRPVSPWYYLLAVVPYSLFGGSVTYSVATLCYISDVSSAQERPYRMATYEAALFIGLMSGSFLSGYLYEYTNATFVFLTSCSCIFVAVCITVFFIPESLNRRRFNFIENLHVNVSSDLAASLNVESNQFRKLFDLAAVKEMWRTCFKPRECNDRAIIWLASFAQMSTFFVIYGSMAVFYLFIRETFHWTIKEFNTFETLNIFLSLMGNIMGVIILRRIFKLSIVSLGLLALLSESTGCFLRAFADTNWLLYLSIGVSALRSMGNPMCRTIISNILPPNELGKFFTFQGVLQAFLPFFASPIYTGIYSLTLTTFPGFYNLLSANLILLAICYLLIILRKKRAFPVHYQQRF